MSIAKILSNTRYHSGTLRKMLEICGLLEFIDVVVASADIGYRKPDAKSYDSVLKELGCEAKECYFCGDSLEKDYYGPLAAGFKGAMLIDFDLSERAKEKINSLERLNAFFEN